jgi:hypothetical protein
MDTGDRALHWLRQGAQQAEEQEPQRNHAEMMF